MIDILLATFNAEKYIAELLDSLMRQTYRDFRIIAGDDGSSDKTRQILKEYSDRFPGVFEIHEFSCDSSSAKENFFRLLEYSDGDFVMFADQDDVWKESKIETLLETAVSVNSEVPHLVHSDLFVTDENLHVISQSMFDSQQLPRDWSLLCNLLVQNNVTGCTVMFNRALKEKIRYDDISKIVMHDWWAALVASAFGRVTFVDRPLVYYRQHGDNSVGAKDVRSAAYVKNRMGNTSDIKKNIRDTYIQAGEFLRTYGDELKSFNRELLEVYSGFGKLSLPKKIKMLNQYSLWKNTPARRTGQIIWG